LSRRGEDPDLRETAGVEAEAAEEEEVERVLEGGGDRHHDGDDDHPIPCGWDSSEGAHSPWG
jgi:hypothetical protein